MNEERTEVFRGHLEECLRHLCGKFDAIGPRGSKGSRLVKKPMAEFCGVTVDSVVRWLHSSHPPVGEENIKLVCYLDFIGYRVIELERMPKPRRGFFELIGYGIISSQQALEILGYSTTSQMYQVLQGNCGSSKSKDQKIWDAWKQKSSELDRRKEMLREQRRLVNPTNSVTKPIEDSKPMALGANRKAALSIINGLLTLLEEGAFENLSEDDLAELEQSADTILKVSARLSALGSRLVTSSQPKGGS